MGKASTTKVALWDARSDRILIPTVNIRLMCTEIHRGRKIGNGDSYLLEKKKEEKRKVVATGGSE